MAFSPAMAAPDDLLATPPDWRISDGLTPYPAAIAEMQARIAQIRDGRAEELVWLVEHPPLFTAGTSARAEDLFNPHGFPTYDAGRGGQWTYHGPGQRTAYVMLDLTRRHGIVRPRDVRSYVHGLEEWLIRALDRFGVRGERREGRIGIWVADRAAGTEANVEPDLAHFDGIVPCGVREHGVTSLHALGIPATMAEADAALRGGWAEVFL